MTDEQNRRYDFLGGLETHELALMIIDREEEIEGLKKALDISHSKNKELRRAGWVNEGAEGSAVRDIKIKKHFSERERCLMDAVEYWQNETKNARDYADKCAKKIARYIYDQQ
jgi:hypothetical protein